MKKLSELLSKNFNKLHLLIQESRSLEELEFASNKIDELKKLLDIKINSIDEFLSQGEALKLLNSCLFNVFPAFAEVNQTLAQSEPADKNVKNIYEAKYLPFRTRDQLWLAKYLRQVCYHFQSEQNADRLKNNEKPKALQEISLKDLLQFISSKEFIAERDNYEHNVVRSIVLARANNTKEDSAIWFRKSILEEAVEMGIDEYSAKVAMELDTLWRGKINKNSFDSYIYSKKFSLLIPTQEQREWLQNNKPTALANLDKAEQQFSQFYYAFEEYKYYQWDDVKEIIDQLNLATPNMKVSKDKAEKLYVNGLKEACANYVAELRACQNLIKRNMDSEISK